MLPTWHSSRPCAAGEHHESWGYRSQCRRPPVRESSLGRRRWCACLAVPRSRREQIRLTNLRESGSPTGRYRDESGHPESHARQRQLTNCRQTSTWCRNARPSKVRQALGLRPAAIALELASWCPAAETLAGRRRGRRQPCPCRRLGRWHVALVQARNQTRRRRLEGVWAILR